MAVNRFSFNETGNIGTQEYLDYLGFINRLSMRFDFEKNQVILQKGSLIYGFKSGNARTHGFLIDDDVYRPISLSTSDTVKRYFVTMDINGGLEIDDGIYSNVHGIGANITGIPWYTYKGKALIGKIFTKNNFLTGMIVCDDPYWCEFEGVF